LLAACDGAAYIADQIESIRAQSRGDWILLVRDDGSRDATPGIVGEFINSDPRIRLLDEPAPVRSGAKSNFSALLKAGLETDSEVFFLADQDDIWEPRRIEACIEAFPTSGAPRLVFCDYDVVDQQLQPISRARLVDHFDPTRPQVADFLSMNYIPGCTMACNRSLAEIACPVPDSSPMHDWWLALTAAALGALHYVAEPLVRYRQHGENVIGASSIGDQMTSVSGWSSHWRRGQVELRQTFAQAGELAQRLRDVRDASHTTLAELQDYASLPGSGRPQRIRKAAELGLRRQVVSARAVLLARLLLLN
jgi:glycosyltransferase involved in cell wall biosynthesis